MVHCYTLNDFNKLLKHMQTTLKRAILRESVEIDSRLVMCKYHSRATYLSRSLKKSLKNIRSNVAMFYKINFNMMCKYTASVNLQIGP